VTIIRCAMCGELNGLHHIGCERYLMDKTHSEKINHYHYFKDVSKLKVIDVYRVLALFNVTDQVIGHAIKKLLVAGGRGAGKDIAQDIKEATDSLVRWTEMRNEDNNNESEKRGAK
jgi:hypothetical protein